jgi:hypothetical protein
MHRGPARGVRITVDGFPLFLRHTLLRSLLVGAAAVAVIAPTTAAHADPTPAQIQASGCIAACA